MSQPNFLFIGPDKTGSSWMYEIFRQHPQCYVSECKDIYFFDRYYDRGLGWYLAHFKKANPDATAIGELSHDYLFSSLAAKRISVDLPNVKLISCLRNPIDRTFSHYLYLIRCGLTTLSFREAIKSIPELIDHSLYYKHLSAYFNIFDPNKIKILYFSELQIDSKKFAKEIFDYLNITSLETINYSQDQNSQKYRPASLPRSRMLSLLFKHGANVARDLGMTNLVGYFHRSPITTLIYKPYAQKDKPKLQYEEKMLALEYFKEDIIRLQDLVHKDLSHWLEV